MEEWQGVVQLLMEEWQGVLVETGVVRAKVEVLPLSQVAEVEGCSLFVE